MGISRQIFQAMVVCVVISLSYQQESDDSYFYYQRAEYPKDCQDIYDQCTDATTRVSGVYLIKPEGYNESFEVFCDQETDNGGWTVFQRRKDDTIDFARPLDYYKTGFGFLNEEHWLGNDKLAYLTNQKKYQLRIELKTRNGQPTFAEYDNFRITDDMGTHRIVSVGQYNSASTASDRISAYDGNGFTDVTGCTSCTGCTGAWWYTSTSANCNNEVDLNGAYNTFHWVANAPLEFSEMKIRPL